MLQPTRSPDCPRLRPVTRPRRLGMRLGLLVVAAGGCALLGACSGGSARSDYYTLRGFFVQPSSGGGALAIAPTD
ncbi:MAG: hypothetical protein KDB18_08740 [Salinibacterium sp.]|nr:hypothetical protein [Salinibacterium sp.]